jgi:hypothetical protein
VLEEKIQSNALPVIFVVMVTVSLLIDYVG